MTRLAGVLEPDQRRSLSISLATRAVNAATTARLQVIVVTSDLAVQEWALGRCDVVADVGVGLSSVVTNAVQHHALPEWLVLHADLPCVDADHLGRFAETASRDGAAIVPSLDGGTNVIAGTGPFEFVYGPGSFHANLARMPRARVSASSALSLEIDTPGQFAALVGLGLAPSLTT